MALYSRTDSFGQIKVIFREGGSGGKYELSYGVMVCGELPAVEMFVVNLFRHGLNGVRNAFSMSYLANTWCDCLGSVSNYGNEKRWVNCLQGILP